jgi:hypothetical protein
MIIYDICQVLEQKPDSLCFGFLCLFMEIGCDASGSHNLGQIIPIQAS